MRSVSAASRRLPSLPVITSLASLCGFSCGLSYDVDHLVATQAEAVHRVAGLELQRQHAHADQVAAVDALEALGDHRLDAQQLRALGRPVARRAGAVFLAGRSTTVGVPSAM